MASFKNIDEYINEQEENTKNRLTKIRKTISNVEPNLTEKISWGMPTFYLNKNIIHFFAFKKHIGIFPGSAAIEHFKNELKDYSTSKGGIKLPYNQDIPYELIEKIVKYNLGHD